MARATGKEYPSNSTCESKELERKKIHQTGLTNGKSYRERSIFRASKCGAGENGEDKMVREIDEQIFERIGEKRKKSYPSLERQRLSENSRC